MAKPEDVDVSHLDAEALRRGIEDGREGRNSNPYEGDSGLTTIVELAILGPFAALAHDPGDRDKSNAYEVGRALGSLSGKK